MTVAAADVRDARLRDLDLTFRAYNCLKGIRTIGDLIQRSEDDLLDIPNFGRRCLEDVRDRLDARGLALSKTSWHVTRALMPEPTSALERIADALERIAAALESPR